MLSNIASALYATLVLSPLAWAAVSPTAPSGDTVVRVGQPLNALWTVDGTGESTDVVVQLMTGDNLQVSFNFLHKCSQKDAPWCPDNMRFRQMRDNDDAEARQADHPCRGAVSSRTADGPSRLLVSQRRVLRAAA